MQAADVQKTEQPETCPECGAPPVEEMTCWEMLGGIIAWESQDPDLMAQHFLTVASYNLQHPAQFTDEALAGLKIAVVDYLDHSIPASELRRRASRTYEGKRRVLKPKGERRPILSSWPITIADVYIPNHPAGAADRVRGWGEIIAASIRSCEL